MLQNLDDLLNVVARLYPTVPPAPFGLLRTVRDVRSGAVPVEGAYRLARTTPARFAALREANDPIEATIGVTLAAASSVASLTRAREILGQLLLGQLAERAFERIYKTTMGTDELQLVDDRGGRTDTDYMVKNGQGRPVFRINIKFFGTLFRNAASLVKLEPENCFALATYKIYQGLLKQDEEGLPYLFVIVGVAGLTGGVVGASVPEDFVHLVALAHTKSPVGKLAKVEGKRSIEERILDYLMTEETNAGFQASLADFAMKIEGAPWRVLSARRGYNLLRDKLFDRVFAMRVKSFTRNYPRAELDMHFSLSEDLTPLADFLQLIKVRGLPGLSVALERGTI